MRLQARLRQASVGLVIAGLHVAGVLVWWSAKPALQWVRNAASRLPTVAVWLPEPTQQPPRPPAPRPHEDRKARPEGTTSATAAASTTATVAPTTSLPPAVELRDDAQDTPSPNTGPLNLNLSRKDIASVAPRSFAEQSPFHGRLPATVERQIANAAAATGPWTEERVDHDRIRFRRGNTCVMMQRPRAASIDPFSEAAARLPWRANVTDCAD